MDLEENKFSKPIPVDLTVLTLLSYVRRLRVPPPPPPPCVITIFNYLIVFLICDFRINTCGNAPDFHIYDSAGDVADPDKGTTC